MDKSSIDKKIHESTAKKVQTYQNNLIDNYIKDYAEGEVYKKTPPAIIWAELSILNKPEIYKYYNKITRSKFTSNDLINKLLLRDKANKELNRVVENQTERIIKNLNYVENVLNNNDVNTEDYLNALKHDKSQNRSDVLKAIIAGAVVVSSAYSFRSMEPLVSSMLRQSQMGSQHEYIKEINDNKLNNTGREVYTIKTWIHTHGGSTTRHASNHMQKRRLDEPFIVVNDVTLEIDEMQYPSDPAGSPSNSYICYCECDYGNEDGSISTVF